MLNEPVIYVLVHGFNIQVKNFNPATATTREDQANNKNTCVKENSSLPGYLGIQRGAAARYLYIKVGPLV